MPASHPIHDVFVSYTASDRERVRPLVEFLQQSGLDVWWDRRIAPGAGFDSEIQDALDRARCVLVIWSTDSIESDWVITEASEGLERGILVPVAIDPVRPPLAFRRRQTIDVTDSRSASDDVLTAIRNAIEGRTVELQQARRRVRRPWLWVLTAVNVGVFLGVAGMLWKLVGTEQIQSVTQTARTPTLLRTNIDLPPGVDLFNDGATLALSPDGDTLVIVGQHDGRTQLYLRSLNQAQTRPIAGTVGGLGPFFSPDGRWVGFWANGLLEKVSLTGGEPLVICEATTESGAAWLPDGTIVFSDGIRLQRVSADGGDPQPVTMPDAAQLEYAHLSPVALPGGKAVLFEIFYNGGERSVAVLSLGRRKWQVLAAGARQPRFMAPGIVIVNRGGTLETAPFDVVHRAVSGPFTSLGAGASGPAAATVASYDVAAAGRSLVYVNGSSMGNERGLYSVDLHGKAELLSFDRKAYWYPALSPDGSKLAVTVFVNKRVSEVWVLDLVRKTWLRLTSGHNDWQPIWKDSKTLLFARGIGGSAASWDEDALPVSGSGTPERLTSFAHRAWSTAVAPDHQVEVVETNGSGLDLWVKPFALGAEAQPFIAMPGAQVAATQGFAPDGRWLAYTSNATGRYQVYVTDFPAGSNRYRVSRAGGGFPCWSRNGHQIFYWHGQTMMAVAVQPGKTFAAGTPHALFITPFTPFTQFDVAPDGKHFYVVGYTTTPTSPIVFVPDVTAELRGQT